MVQWYYMCITHRNLFIEINGVKLIITTGIGFPQGGVCSAKFWVIAYDDAVDILNEHRVFGQVFADEAEFERFSKFAFHWSISRVLNLEQLKIHVRIMQRENGRKEGRKIRT